MRSTLVLALALSVCPASSQAFLSSDELEGVGAVRLEAAAAGQAAQDNASATIELVEERLCVATLRMKKSEFTFDLGKHLKNWASAEERAIVVADTTCDKWTIGQEISGKFDTWGFVFNGDFARYVVRLKDKKIVSRYFNVARSGAQKEIPAAAYQAELSAARAAGKTVVTVPYAGMVRSALLDKPLAELKISEKKPLPRYFVTVEVKNSTLTLDLEKHLRNAMNTHQITLEVSAESYAKTERVWDTRLSLGSFIIKGNLSFISGKVVKKWTESDPRYWVVKTEDGRALVVPAGSAR